jgi:hypothetical protein
MPLGEDVAVLATLVALVSDVPLKGEVVHASAAYLSPAPHAVPQAAGFSAGFSALSPAPHAVPQATGFSAGFSGLFPDPHAEPQAADFSAGLSPLPQAEPQAVGLSTVIIITPWALCATFQSVLFISVLY